MVAKARGAIAAIRRARIMAEGFIQAGELKTYGRENENPDGCPVGPCHFITLSGTAGFRNCREIPVIKGK